MLMSTLITCSTPGTSLTGCVGYYDTLCITIPHPVLEYSMHGLTRELDCSKIGLLVRIHVVQYMCK